MISNASSNNTINNENTRQTPAEPRTRSPVGERTGAVKTARTCSSIFIAIGKFYILLLNKKLLLYYINVLLLITILLLKWNDV